MRRWIISFMALGLLAIASGAATAQDAPETDGRSARRGKIDRACAVSLERFCPALATTPGQTRNQVICLKPYRTSLPLTCRSAVTAALR